MTLEGDLAKIQGDWVELYLDNGKRISGMVAKVKDNVLYLRREYEQRTDVPLLELGSVYLIPIGKIAVVEVGGFTAAEREIIYVPKNRLEAAKEQMKRLEEAVSYA